jgi:hypothetical protein
VGRTDDAPQGQLEVKLNRKFSIVYLVLTVAIVVTEVIGVQRKGGGDTITEHWRWLDGHLWPWAKWALRVGTVGLLGWTALHLGGKW